LSFLFFLVSCVGVRLSPVGTFATVWPFVLALVVVVIVVVVVVIVIFVVDDDDDDGDDDESGIVIGMKICKGN
jgi:uncharacterized membrane protein